MFLTQSDFLIAGSTGPRLHCSPCPEGWPCSAIEGRGGEGTQTRSSLTAPRQSGCQGERVLGPAECPPSVGTAVPAESGFPREVAHGHLDVLTKAGVSGDS